MHTGLSPSLKQLQIDHPLNRPHKLRDIPPPDAKYIDRFYFYGWDVSPDWLIQLSLRYKTTPMFGIRAPADGLRILKAVYKDVCLVNALVEPGETYEKIYQGKNGDQMTMMVCVYTNVGELLHRRATEGQLLQLIKMFGREPRWYKDGYTMDHFLDKYEFFLPM